eukprot:CAMPEP_0194037466 /NCGR_PEP_ID=MMETSP0009_2-20130614/9821_1 /TAXON_ID=210454 /ORGANISM="Grammatophora oceanica, Strain CCMP 410" /LENGTH=146 /DNA_ID=CAMNT_0038679637 /DNA_START=19 /DNA_END=459 /DNA_ORIENTATION=-
MPLASKARSSLPATIDSSTKATKSKALKRRASLRGKRGPSPARPIENKENAPPSPGPTRYQNVAKERGGVLSPSETRSAKEEKGATQRTFAKEGSIVGADGLFVTISSLSPSPPGQAANRRREAKELTQKEAPLTQEQQQEKAEDD